MDFDLIKEIRELGGIRRGKTMSRKILFLLLMILFLFIAGIISYALVIRCMFIDGSISVGSL